jgi:hypothetical protein
MNSAAPQASATQFAAPRAPTRKCVSKAGGAARPVGKPSRIVRSCLAVLLVVAAGTVDAAVSYVANSTDTANPGTNLVIAVPGATQTGDLLVAIISVRGGSGQTINTPAGWTLLRRDDVAGGTSLGQAVFWRFATAAVLGTNVTFSGWASNRAVGAMVAYRGADNTSASPIDVSGFQGQTTAGATITAPSVTTAVPDTYLAFAFGQGAGNGTLTPPVGITVRVNNLETGSTANGATLEVADAGFSGTGATTAYTETSNRNANAVGQTIAIKPLRAAYAYYQMEELAWGGVAGEVIDSSGNGRNGIRSGTAQTTASGRVCRGAVIPSNTTTGTQDAIDANFDLNNLGDRGSISFWFRSNTSWSGAADRTLLDASTTTGTDKFFFLALLANGQLRFNLEDTADADYPLNAPAQGFAAGTWVHVAITWVFNAASDNRMRIYIDGTQQAERATAVVAIGTTLGDLFIGDNSSTYIDGGATPNSADGTIDEVRIYDFEQTATEIQTDRDATHPCPGPVAEYRLDETSWNGTAGEVQDSGVNGLHGRAIGGATAFPARICNGARLNPPPAAQTAYLEVADDPLLDITAALTVTAWIQPFAWPGSDLMSIASKDTNWEFHVTPTGQVNWWWNTGAAALTTAVAGGAAPINNWTHVAITFRQGQQVIYINGVSRATGTNNSLLFTNANPLQIGADQGLTNRLFRGLIDEVRVYDRTLAAAEVNQVMNETRPCVILDHYRVQHATSGVNCQAENVTVTAHDASHTAVPAEGRTITISADRVAGAAGTRGDFSIVTGTGLLTNGAADDGVASYNFGVAETTVVLAYKNTWVQTVNFSVNDGSITDLTGAASGDAAYNQDLSFAPSGFRFVDGSGNNLSNQIAGVTSGAFYLQAIQTGAGGCTTPGPCTGVCTVPAAFGNGALVGVDLAFRCDNPTTCQAGQQVSIVNNGTTAIAANPAAGVTTWTTKTLQFGANGQALLNLFYPDVGALSLHVKYNIPLGTGAPSPTANDMTGASNSFVVKPYGFTIATASPNEIRRTSDNFTNPAAADASGNWFIRAGDDFTATVTAVNSSGTATPNYGKEILAETARLTASLVGGLGLANNPGLANPTAFGAFNAGSATGTTFSWGEVGIITLTPTVGDGDYLGAGDVTGTTSGNVGRFIPYDFAVTRNSPAFDTACVGGSFTYLGQPFDYSTAPVIGITARNRSGATTQNYRGSFWMITALSLGAKTYSAMTGTLDESGLPGVDPVIRYDGDGVAASPPAAGTGRLEFGSGTGLNFSRSTPVAPFDAEIALSINVVDLDATTVALVDGVAGANPVGFGAASAGNGIAFGNGKTIRFGRLRAQNAAGSSLLDLPLVLETQYYNGTGFVRNTGDSCTGFAASVIGLDTYTGNLSAPAPCETAIQTAAGTVNFSSGLAQGLKLRKPGAANAGSVNLTVNLGAAVAVPNTCTAIGAGGMTPGATSPANLPYLRANWGSGTFDQDPVARATFGIYRSADEFIYFRENF